MPLALLPSLAALGVQVAALSGQTCLPRSVRLAMPAAASRRVHVHLNTRMKHTVWSVVRIVDVAPRESAVDPYAAYPQRPKKTFHA